VRCKLFLWRLKIKVFSRQRVHAASLSTYIGFFAQPTSNASERVH